MSEVNQNSTTSGPGPILSNLPNLLLFGGIGAAVIGGLVSQSWTQVAFSYLLAFMFLLSLCLGSLFLVIIHHLVDANWSLPIRRVLEHISSSIWVLGIGVIPIILLRKELYTWMKLDASTDHALHAKHALFNEPVFIFVSILLFVIWTVLSRAFRKQSLLQDETGSAECTGKMRKYAGGGIFIFGFSLTLGAIFWMKGLQHQWFSTMYGVYYFAESVWVTLATTYLITYLLKKWGPLKDVVTTNTFHSIGTLLFAFTVFYSYIHFSQYFLIWNAAIPEETFWYVIRDQGSWHSIGLLLIFGHFFVPFLLLLRIDAKLNPNLMVPVIVLVWCLHYIDMSFNIMPVLSPEGFHAHLLDFAFLALGAGAIMKVVVKAFNAHPPYPQRDPRIAEAMNVYVEPLSEQTATGKSK
jgi:hypothetical protein